MSSSEGNKGWSEMWNSRLGDIKGAQEAVYKYSESSNIWSNTKTYGGVALAAGAALYAVPCVIGVLGFKAGGIAAGSLAAKAMSASAVANGGGVAAGGVVATLQSVGAAGLGIGGKTVIAGTSGGLYKYMFPGTSPTENKEKN